MLDFDDGKTTKEALLEKQKKWRYNSLIFSSQNHQKIKYKKDYTEIPPCDRLRVFIPFREPIKNEFDRQAVEGWFKENYPTVDSTCMGKNRYFAHGTLAVWSFKDKDKCLDWRKLKKLYDHDVLPSENLVSLDDIIKDSKGNETTFSELSINIPIFCPVCGDAEYRGNTDKHNGVKLINKKGIPFIHCSSCKSRKMGYKKSGNYYLHPNDGFHIKSEENNAVVFIDTIKCRLYSGCDANVNNDCIQDCAGEWGGDSVLDACGVCDNSPNTGICDVAWVTTEDSLNVSTGVIVFPYLYYTEGYEPTVIDTLFSCHPFYDFDSPLGYSYDDCIQMCEELNESQSLSFWAPPLNCPEVPNVSYFIYSFKGDTILFADSVKSIAHFIPINYFEVVKLDDNKILLNPNDYDADIFRFEYIE